MSRLIVIVCCLLSVAKLHAQQQSYTINQSDQLGTLFEKHKEYQRKIDVAEGYRIQITYTSDRDEAYKSKAKLYREFDAVNSYVEYEQPNYKLRMGDFRTRLDATAFLQEVVKLYPGAFIVKDRVKIK